MSGPEQPSDPARESAAKRDAAARRRLAEVFGDVLPEATGDDRDEPDGRDGSERDRWYRDQVPPHHG